jgi:hypothetical protein
MRRPDPPVRASRGPANAGEQPVKVQVTAG